MSMKEVLSPKQAILATLHYFDLIDFAPSATEIEEYLYGWTAPLEVIRDLLGQMPGIAHAHGFYCLRGRESLAEMRKEHAHFAESLWRKVRRWGFLLALCPFVKTIAVCNSLAYGNVKESSDIDLFIVTEKEKLATVRFFMKVLTQLFGLRAHHDKIAGRFCLSFFVSEAAMDLKNLAHEFDPHLAYFAATMKPIFGEKTYMAFLSANNAWTGNYFKRQLKPKMERLQSHPVAGFFKIVLETILRLFGRPLEAFLSKYQAKKDAARKKLFPHSKGIVMNKDVFKFHEKDPREEIAIAFQ